MNTSLKNTVQRLADAAAKRGHRSARPTWNDEQRAAAASLFAASCGAAEISGERLAEAARIVPEVVTALNAPIRALPDHLVIRDDMSAKEACDRYLQTVEHYA